MTRNSAMAACCWLALTATLAADEVTAVAIPALAQRNEWYVSNREPLAHTPLVKLPIRSIEPRGWLRKQLELEAAGFTGHLSEISKFLRREGNAWLEPEAGEHGWEEVPYWLKGYLNLAYLLRDEAMIKEAHTWIEAAIRSQLADGWFGPVSNRTRVKGKADLWPNMIMLFCLQDYHDYTGDARVLELMNKYCQYLESIPEQDFFPDYWDKMRGGDQLWSIYWLYNRGGEPSLLKLAEKVHRKTAPWSDDVVNWHNVNFAQAFDQPAIYSMQSQNPAHRQAANRNYAKMRGLYGQVPGALYGGDENSRPGCDDPRQAIETCGIVEFMLSAEQLLTITGETLWADRCEDAAFNMLPAALTADLKALRYLTAPNLVVSDQKNHAPGFQNSGPMLHMNPHIHRCCQHNWGHGWPYFAEHLYFATPDNGLAAVFYSASQVKAKVGAGVEVTLEQDTHYPFDEAVTFTLHTPKPVQFPLYLRVPRWCSPNPPSPDPGTEPAVEINGKSSRASGSRQSYLCIQREWQDGDRVRLTLPMQTKVRHWAKNHGSVSVDRGPLTYSLKIGERYARAGGTDAWPAWEILPTTPWNYGIVLKGKDFTESFTVRSRPWPTNDMPFTHEGAPVEIQAKGKKIPQWQLDKTGLVAELQDSPVQSDEPLEDITLIPMGAARLRISSFPVISERPNAQVWTAGEEKAKE